MAVITVLIIEIIESLQTGANGYLKKPFGPDEAMDVPGEAMEK